MLQRGLETPTAAKGTFVPFKAPAKKTHDEEKQIEEVVGTYRAKSRRTVALSAKGQKSGALIVVLAISPNETSAVAHMRLSLLLVSDCDRHVEGACVSTRASRG
jgi:hypothetical protein